MVHHTERFLATQLLVQFQHGRRHQLHQVIDLFQFALGVLVEPALSGQDVQRFEQALRLPFYQGELLSQHLLFGQSF